MAVLERSELEASPLADLHAIANEIGLDGFRRLRKADLIDAILGEPSKAKSTTEEDDDSEEERPARARRRRAPRARRSTSSRSQDDGDEGKPSSDAGARGA